MSDSDHQAPVHWLDRLSNALLREPQDREQLVSLLRDAEQRNLLDADALAMIEGVLQFSGMQVRSILIPRSQMVVFNVDQPFHEIMPIAIESGHSRFPVTGDNPDEIIGILHAKDLLVLQLESTDEQTFDLHDILRPPIFVPESKRLDVLLKEFRMNRNHMAIVVDEYGSVTGFVTIEDILEQIVGDIADEFDADEDAFIKKHSEQEYVIKALTPIAEFNEYFESSMNTDEFDTIGGLVAKSFGYMPQPGDSITVGHYHFEVIRADKRRIHLLRMTVPLVDKIKD